MADGGRSASNTAFMDSDFLFGANATFIEAQYARFLSDPNSLEPSWRAYFASMEEAPDAAREGMKKPEWSAPDWRPVTEEVALFDGNWAAIEAQVANKLGRRVGDGSGALSALDLQAAAKDSVKALMMIRAYRMRGHLAAKLDPLGIEDHRDDHAELEPEAFGFGATDMDRPIFIDRVLGLEYASVRQMLDILKRTYCSTFAVEFMHISDPKEKSWIQGRIEGPDKEISFTPEGKRAIYAKLVEAETFERFMQKRYPGTKRFGLDGGEALIPAMEQIIKRGGALGVEEIIIGMPHRGRLNVLAAVMGKPYHVIFHEFRGGSATPEDVMGSGDVKYHMGASSDRQFDDNKVHLSLSPNPSHLEIVNPVVIGKARAKQLQFTALGRVDQARKVIPVLLHGDAAFAGQGVVAECFALSGLRGYRTGGTIHLIVNNQIGFTTSPRFSRSSPYPSDVALMVQAPIFHVNGDDPEAVTFAARVATEYRQKFGKDVVIDMFCYRRYGHNEGDDPSFTQPLMYKKIKDQPTSREIYQKRIIGQNVVSQDDAEKTISDFEVFLDTEFEAGKNYKPNKADWLDGVWTGLGLPGDDDRRGETSLPLEKLKELGLKMTTIPDSVDCHKTLRRVIDARRTAIESGNGLDWATAEHLAFATLLDEGTRIRLSGQDSARGTFSQRHSFIVDQTTEERYAFLDHLRAGQAQYEVIDSLLSEEAVLGFEYGYSTAAPNQLVLWEAQFGDFANGAQVVVDQFMSCAEKKWLRMSGLVMLLPHGYEGQGPEHSSARLERYLQMCAEDNMQVANCSTPANYYHILRRQVRRNFRKPLIIMTPKSLLRHKRCVSDLAEMGPASSFHRILWDDADVNKDAYKETTQTTMNLKPDSQIKRVVMCTGKVYYDLLEEREKRGRDDIYLLRIEQLYPFPAKSLVKEMTRFLQAEVIWCQEEPKNMGAFSFVEPNIEWVLDKAGCAAKRARYAGRPPSAATATGLMSKHLKELQAFLDDVFS
jgi:2-oxoglutarate dehydrogenase E1 component